MHSKSSLNFICSVPAAGITLDGHIKKIKKQRQKMKKKENIYQTSSSGEIKENIYQTSSSGEIKRRGGAGFHLPMTPLIIP